jgi:outer membrane protein OmpA-like peptidoglycan-associated protein
MATTTFSGDTGLWFVPTAEVLPAKRWSASGYRRGINYVQGFTNVADFAGTVGVGIADRAEVFASFSFITRIDRDLRPLFVEDREVGGAVDRYPYMRTTWSGNQVGDLLVGAKLNLFSQWKQRPMAVAVRGLVKLPTGDDEAGVSTGTTDGSIDLVVSKEVGQKVEYAGYAGFEFRGQPDGFDGPGGGFRWGAGVGFPTRSPLRGVFELTGVFPSSDTLTVVPPAVLLGTDGSLGPLVSDVQTKTRGLVGATWQHRNGFFLGGGLGFNFPMESRDGFGADSDPSKLRDYFDWQVRLGYHPGVRVYVPPPPPPPPPPPAPKPEVKNQPPTVTAQCDPCTVEVGRTSTLTANGMDPDKDPLTYKWSVPTGTLATPGERQTVWTAPQQEGPVTATVTVSDGRGGTATATVTIQVVRPPAKTYTFEDVHFDFDRFTLRAEATRVLDEAVSALKQDATLRVQIEGHTCNIGTAEYNLALGDRRAAAVRDYLVSRGVTTDRLTTVSYGEERPKHDNAREETRRLNRRAALTVNLQR